MPRTVTLPHRGLNKKTERDTRILVGIAFYTGMMIARHLQLMFGSSLNNGLSRFGHFCVSARRSAPLSRKLLIHSALIGVFFAVDRRNVRRIFIEIGSSNPKFLAVRVDPLPQDFA